MLMEVGFSEARSKFTNVIDAAQRNQPTVIKPRKSSEDGSIIMTIGMFNALTDRNQAKEFTIEEFLDDGDSVTISVDPFDVAVNGKTREAAIAAAVDDVTDYAQDYINEFPLHYNSKNRRLHFALALKVLLCNSKEEVKELIGFA